MPHLDVTVLREHFRDFAVVVAVQTRKIQDVPDAVTFGNRMEKTSFYIEPFFHAIPVHVTGSIPPNRRNSSESEIRSPLQAEVM